MPRPRPLTLIAPLKSQDPASLKALETLMSERGRALFEDSPSTHMAALVMLGDRQGRSRLFMSADYDGDLAAYLDELWSSQPQTMDAMFSYCSGYEGREGFHAFVKQRSHKAGAYFTAFQDESAQSIKAKAEVRSRLEQAAGDDAAVVASFADAVTVAQGRMSASQRLAVAVRAFVSRLKGKINDAFWGALVGLAQRFMLRLLAGKKPRSAAAHINQTYDRAIDLRYQQVQVGQVQNQMTNISWVLPGRRPLLRLGLAAVNLAARYAYPPGDLAGVKSVHFARWVLIDGGTGLLFEGNFDGTWENYMGEFTDRIAWGLDMIWGNTETYPPAGMRDIWAFKRYIGDLQYPPAMWYMAYPQVSVQNTLRDRNIFQTLQSRQPGNVERAVGLL